MQLALVRRVCERYVSVPEERNPSEHGVQWVAMRAHPPDKGGLDVYLRRESVRVIPSSVVCHCEGKGAKTNMTTS